MLFGLNEVLCQTTTFPQSNQMVLVAKPNQTVTVQQRSSPPVAGVL